MGEFSKVAQMGYLNQYSKSEIMDRLSAYQIDVLESSETGELIRFAGESIQIDLQFDGQGTFIKIIAEEWIDMGMKHIRK